MITAVVLFVLGLLLGVVVERLLHRPAPAPATTGSPNAATIPGARAPRRKRRAGRIFLWTSMVVLIGLIAGSVYLWRWASRVFDSIEKVDVSAQLAPESAGGTNYLLVGSDNGRTGEEQRAGVEGARSDTIMVLRVEKGSAKMLSLNRDLWVQNPATGQNGRLNATYNQGPANLIEAVTQNFGIPIQRYIEIDFVSFAGLVDSFGGIDIVFANPAFDLASGLDVKQAGVVHLDGAQALAYVRSRHYYEMIDGKPTAEGGLPDVNRTKRQQAFLRAIMAKAGAKRNPLTLMHAADNMSNGLRIDDDMTMLQAARFAWAMGRLDPVSVPLPVTPRTTSGGAAVLDLDQPAADAVLAQFR